jgi:8-oxo-dGTP pyrophosphatase MutT (NUDIX family)
MPRIEFAQKAVITDGVKFLMVRKSSDDPYNPGQWEFPGGRMKDADDLDEHIRREVLEETGFQIEPGKLLDMWSWDMTWDGDSVRVIAVSRFCHLLDTCAGAPRREKDDYIDEQCWYSRAELLSLDVIHSQLATVKLIAEHQS